MRGAVLVLFTILPIYSRADTVDSKKIIPQTIVYKTAHASQVDFVWTMTDWVLPEKRYQPQNTIIKDGMAYSTMEGSTDSFYLTLNVPVGTYLNYMIRVSADENKNAVDWWDTNWGMNYNHYVDGKYRVKIVNDEKLAIVTAQKPPFNLLNSGWTVLSVGFILFLFSFLFILIKKSYSNSNWFSARSFLAGALTSIILLMVLIRLQMNGFLTTKQYLAPGLVFYDTIFMLTLALISFSLLYLTRRYKYVQRAILVLSGITVFLTGVSSILNIEIVHQLGRPISYSWIYYSDFLQSADAKNAMKYFFSLSLLKNLLFIIAGTIFAALAFSVFLRHVLLNKTAVIFFIVFGIAFIPISYFQLQTNKFDKAKIINPVVFLARSWISKDNSSSLLTMKVSEEAANTLKMMHLQQQYPKLVMSDSIMNIIVFVMESTPANLVQIFDSTYKVTPHLDEWKNRARIYTNMYAHIPTTANTMFSIISGLYPMISYKSFINEYPQISTTSLPKTLKRNDWSTSLFFSSDLSYSQMNYYLKNQQIDTTADFKTINCNIKKFESGYSNLDGLNDRCIVNQYISWVENLKGRRTFSILWSNQTHYPYFVAGTEKSFTSNALLNTYLNALQQVDEAFNQLMLSLKEQNRLNNTLVIVIGDHGEAFGTHNQYSHASNIYEENMHVPCLLINPRFFHGEVDHRIASMIDIAPTITHLTGTLPSALWEGESLLGAPRRDHAFFLGPFSDFQFGSRFDNWKLIYNTVTDSMKLFDILKDPGELNNIAAENKNIVQKEYELIGAWVQYHNNRISQVLKPGSTN